MDSFCPQIKSNLVEKNCGQHTNLSFKGWLMYLTNSLFITITNWNQRLSVGKIILGEWISFRLCLIFSRIFRFWCSIIPRFNVISEKFNENHENDQKCIIWLIWIFSTYVHICQNKAKVIAPAILPCTAIRVWIKCTESFCLVVFSLYNM